MKNFAPLIRDVRPQVFVVPTDTPESDGTTAFSFQLLARDQSYLWLPASSSRLPGETTSTPSPVLRSQMR